jgi:phenylacetate-CoA ligase
MWEFAQLVIMLYQLTPQWLGGEDGVRTLQEQRLRRLLLHVNKHSPFYSRRFAGIDIERCQLSDLPTLSKSEMMANFDNVLTDRRIKRLDLERFLANSGNLGKLFLGRYGISHTSGSQGPPALIVQDKNALMLTFRGAVRARDASDMKSMTWSR